MQRNYNAGFAFELLKPVNGVVNVRQLHDALERNLKISLIEKDVIADIIARLAYVNENELVLTDMIFFEPYEDDPSFATYRRNYSQKQDPKDKSWHPLYKELWKALIKTVQNRRFVQKEMCDQYPDAVEHLFQYFGYTDKEKLSMDEVEEFINDQLNSKIDEDLLVCIMR